MPSTLTAGIEDGKQSKKIERNSRKGWFCEILLLRCGVIVWMFAWGLIDAQLEAGDVLPVRPPSRGNPPPTRIVKKRSPHQTKKKKH
ncbi:MAG: hypothetical protein ABWY28_19890, partial [Pseudomonas prosekii]